MVDQLRAGETTLRSGGPLWIAQLWINAVFEKFMVLNRSHVPIKLPIEGYRLAHLEPNFNVKGDEVIDHFWFVFTKFLKSRTFEGGDLNFAPFSRRQIGPNWFRQSRVKKEDKKEAQLIVDKHWSNYLAVQVLPIVFPGYKKD
ncbi:hypothetical protein PIB30_082284 [Stylosanthes scabra]|uniref:Uncharacterized protein n=1 Tax=Stylosanthes scabra TaxID=79078 RepID=A0ABU6QS38_9FABA|nr:hypothetical protein [Stylosanthes scabra]